MGSDRQQRCSKPAQQGASLLSRHDQTTDTKFVTLMQTSVSIFHRSQCIGTSTRTLVSVDVDPCAGIRFNAAFPTAASRRSVFRGLVSGSQASHISWVSRVQFHQATGQAVFNGRGEAPRQRSSRIWAQLESYPEGF